MTRKNINILKKQHNMITFRMNKIDIEQFAILSTEILQNDPLNIHTSLSFGVAPNSNFIANKIRIEYNNNENHATYLVLEMVCYFEIQDTSWQELKQDNNKFRIPKDFLAHLAVHTVGTARGVLFCKTEKTVYNTIILPPINVTQMITEDLVIEC